MKPCKFCLSPIASRLQVCGMCKELKEEAYRALVYRFFMLGFKLKEGETPQQFHARQDTRLQKLAAGRHEWAKKIRNRAEARYYKKPCDICGETGRHETYCDLYTPPKARGKKKKSE